MGISKQQWINININLLGLRSEDNETQIISAASYAMNCGKSWNDPIPDNWDTLLSGTIQMMQGFEGYESRYLLIVSPSHGMSSEYSNCFPKCSSKPSEVKVSISLDNSIETLVNWVLNQV